MWKELKANYGKKVQGGRCQMCQSEEDTTEHVLECNNLNDQRGKEWGEIVKIYRKNMENRSTDNIGEKQNTVEEQKEKEDGRKKAKGRQKKTDTEKKKIQEKDQGELKDSRRDSKGREDRTKQQKRNKKPQYCSIIFNSI